MPSLMLRAPGWRSVAVARATAVAAILLVTLLPQATLARASSTPPVAAATQRGVTPVIAPSDPQPATTFSFSWYAPTKAPPDKNVASAYGVVSSRFSLSGNHGLDVLAGVPRTHAFDCATGALLSGTWEPVTPVEPHFEYNAHNDAYTYSWATKAEWGNTCRLFALALTDGTHHVARYRFTPFHFEAPIAPFPQMNRAVAGADVTINFFAHVAGSDVMASGFPRTQQIDCDSGNAMPGTLALANPSGPSSVQTVDAAHHIYEYVWKTDQAWLAECQQLRLRLTDGTLELLKFRFHGYRPTITTSNGTAAYTENGAPVTVDPGLTIADPKTTLVGAVVTIGAHARVGDKLGFTPVGGIAGSYDATSWTLTLTGSSSLANYQTALRSVRYSSTNNNPGTLRTVDFTADDGSGEGNTASRDVAITPVNDPPKITTTSTALSYAAGSGPKAIDPGLKVNDPDSVSMSGATIAISGNYVSGEESLAFTNKNGITGSWNSTLGVLTLSGNATRVAYQGALRSVTYEHGATPPTHPGRLISFHVTDSSSATSAGATRGIHITSTPSAPVVTTTAGHTNYTENAGPVVIDGGLTVTDADSANLASAKVSIAPAKFQTGDLLQFSDTASITGTYHAATGVLDLSGSDTVANYQAALRSVTFSETEDNPMTSKSIRFTANDGTLDSAVASRQIVITPVNDAPTAATQSLTTSSGIRITIASSDSGTLMTGASDPDDPTSDLTVKNSFGNVTPAGADITLTDPATGAYTYNPPAGYSGAASFSYQICDDGAPVAPQQCSTPATVNVTITGPSLWFVDPSAATQGTGRLTDPFQSVGDIPSGGAAGDRIFVATGTDANGFALASNQYLIGQGAMSDTFDNLLGVTVPASGNGTLDARPSLGGTRPELDDTVTLASGVRVEGLDVSSGADTAMTGTGGLSGVSVSRVALTTSTGTALLLNDVAGTLTFSAIDKDGAGTGIDMTSVGANVTVNGGEIKNTSVAGVSISTGGGDFTDSGKISVSSGRAVSVSDGQVTATLTFSGEVKATAGTGVLLDNNDQGSGTAGAISFTGGLDLTTGSNPALTVTHGGHVAVTGSGNTLTTTSATALKVANTTITSDGLKFESISSDGATSGIILDTTGSSGGLTVTGTGSSASGGTIRNSTDSGIVAMSTKDLKLSWMSIKDNGDATDEDGIHATELTGTGELTSSSVTGSRSENVFIQNTTGTLTNFTIQGPSCFIENNSTSADGDTGITVNARSSATMTVTVDNCSLSGNRTDAIHMDAGDSSNLTAVITNNVITAGTAGNNNGNIGIDATVAASASLDYTINGNKVGTDGVTTAALTNTGINVFNGTTNATPADATGTVKNNTVVNKGASYSGYGIHVWSAGYGTNATNVSGNDVSNVGLDYGILVEILSNGLSASQTGTMVAGVTGNTANVLSGALDAIRVQARGNSTLGARINTNSSSGGGAGGGACGADFCGLYVRQASQTVGGTPYAATFNLEGLTTGSQNAATTKSYLEGQNASITASNINASGTFTGVSSVSGIP